MAERAMQPSDSSDEDVEPERPTPVSRQGGSGGGAASRRRINNPGSAKLPLQIRTLDGRTYQIEARSDWSVRRLKEEFEEWTGKGAGNCMFQYRAKRLADTENLSTYKIDPDSIIHANFRSTGGKYKERSFN